MVSPAQLIRWYEQYKSLSLTFSKEVISVINYQPEKTFISYLDEKVHCIIYSCSFKSAKIIISLNQDIIERISKIGNFILLCFSFKKSATLFNYNVVLSSKIETYTVSTFNGVDLKFAHLKFIQKPPEIMIEKFGRLFDAKINSTKRKSERIVIEPKSMNLLGLSVNEAILVIHNTEQKCILRDISFSGAKIILMGLAKYFVGEECFLIMHFENPLEEIVIPGKIIRFENIQNRKEVTALSINFDESKVSMSFRIHINDYLSRLRINRNAV